MTTFDAPEDLDALGLPVDPIAPVDPVDPERAFLAFVGATSVLLACAGLLVVLLTQPPW